MVNDNNKNNKGVPTNDGFSKSNKIEEKHIRNSTDNTLMRDVPENPNKNTDQNKK